MKIIVDGDACPGIRIIEKAAKENKIETILYCDLNHVIKSDYMTVKYVDSGFQSADMAVANEASAHDIVVTQDFGVAAMALGKKAYAISPKGYIYDDENIDRLLFERHLSAKARRGGKRGVNPKKRNSGDDERLYNNLVHIIKASASFKPDDS